MSLPQLALAGSPLSPPSSPQSSQLPRGGVSAAGRVAASVCAPRKEPNCSPPPSRQRALSSLSTTTTREPNSPSRQQLLSSLSGASLGKPPAQQAPPESPAVSKLALSMQRAAKVGMSQSHLNGAEAALAQARESEALMCAVIRGSPAELRGAIARAQLAGVSRTLLNTAKGQVEQQDAYDLMARAMESEDAVALKSAISKARQAGVGSRDLGVAEDMFVRIEARGRLMAAMDLRREEPLSWAISEGEILGLQSVDDLVLKQAKGLLAELRKGG